MNTYATSIDTQLAALRSNGTDPTWDVFEPLITEARELLPTHSHTLWEPYLTDYTKSLITARDQLADQIRQMPQAPELFERHRQLKNDVRNIADRNASKARRIG